MIQQALRGPGSVLVSGQRGTGKRTIAEILQHFGGALDQTDPSNGRSSLGPSIEELRRAELQDPFTREFTYFHPVEALTYAQQSALAERVGTRRVVFGTRLDPHGREGRERIHPELLARCSLHIPLPTLAERIEDIEALALQILCEVPVRRPVGGISDHALDTLRIHDWPSNVTELERVIRHAVETGCSEQIEQADLPLILRLRSAEASNVDTPDFEFSLAHAERTAIERAMRFARGNKRKAARLLRIGKTTLYRKLHGYDAEFDLSSTGSSPANARPEADLGEPVVDFAVASQAGT